jgi:hypothetical protein
MPARRRETLVVAALLAVLAVAAFGAHLRPGGFYNDDWVYLSSTVYPAEDTFLGAVRALDWLSFRPLQMLYWPFAFRVVGTDPSVHAGWLLAIATLMATLVFVLLRALRLPALHAGLVAALVLLLPVADSTRFWPAQGANVLAVACYLGGVIVALRGLRATERDAVRSHLPAVVLYAASILLYEIAASTIVVTGLLYVTVAGRRGVRPWAIDVALAGALLVLVTSHTFYDPLPLGDQLEHAVKIARQVPYVLAVTFWAPATPSPPARVAVLVVVAAILVAGVLAARRPHADPAYPAALRGWLALALGAALATGAAYLMIVPSATLDPRGMGEFNRGNMLAGMGLVVFAYAVIAVAAHIAVGRLRAWQPAGMAVIAAAAVLIGAGAVHQVRADQRVWEDAAREQERIIDVVDRTTARPPRATTFLTFRAPIATAPAVPVFVAVYDLAGAVRLHYDDPSLRAYPVLSGSRVDCGPRSLTLHNHNDVAERQSAAYGAVRLVDVAGGRAVGVRNRSQCMALTRRLLASAAPR